MQIIAKKKEENLLKLEIVEESLLALEKEGMNKEEEIRKVRA